MWEIRQGDIPGVQLRRRIDISGGSPEAIWRHWLDADRLRGWLCDRASLEPGPPLVLRLETEEPSGTVRKEFAQVVESSEPVRLVLGFRELDAGWTQATRLTVELSGHETGCHVMVFQEGFQQLPLSIGLTAWERSRSRWEQALEKLAETAGGRG